MSFVFCLIYIGLMTGLSVGLSRLAEVFALGWGESSALDDLFDADECPIVWTAGLVTLVWAEASWLLSIIPDIDLTVHLYRWIFYGAMVVPTLALGIAGGCKMVIRLVQKLRKGDSEQV